MEWECRGCHTKFKAEEKKLFNTHLRWCKPYHEFMDKTVKLKEFQDAINAFGIMKACSMYSFSYEATKKIIKGKESSATPVLTDGAKLAVDLSGFKNKPSSNTCVCGYHNIPRIISVHKRSCTEWKRYMDFIVSQKTTIFEYLQTHNIADVLKVLGINEMTIRSYLGFHSINEIRDGKLNKPVTSAVGASVPEETIGKREFTGEQLLDQVILAINERVFFKDGYNKLTKENDELKQKVEALTKLNTSLEEQIKKLREKYNVGLALGLEAQFIRQSKE